MKNNDHNVFQFQVTAESFRETPQRRWPCRDCGRYFSCAAEVAAHRVSATRAVQLVCGQCGDLVSPGDMPTHMATSHAEEVGDHGEVIIFNYQKIFCAGTVRRVRGLVRGPGEPRGGGARRPQRGAHPRHQHLRRGWHLSDYKVTRRGQLTWFQSKCVSPTMISGKYR